MKNDIGIFRFSEDREKPEMSNVAVVTDSNSGITPEMGKELGCYIVPMPFMFGNSDTTYYENVNLTRDQFFDKMESGEVVHTSQPAPNEVLKVWDEALKDHDEVVYIPMSSGLSGSCQMELAKRGKTAAEIREILEKVKFDSSIYIMLDTLVYLKRGGRITPAAAAIGTLLRIKPVLQIKGERLDAFSKARTTAQGKTTMINAMRNDMEKLYGGTAEETCWLYAVHANVPDEEAVWQKEVQDAFPNFHVRPDRLSLSICCHIGPGALAIACSRKLDYDRL